MGSRIKQFPLLDFARLMAPLDYPLYFKTERPIRHKGNMYVRSPKIMHTFIQKEEGAG